MKKRIYLIWILGVVVWNYGFPEMSPFADVMAAIALSVFSINLKRVIK
ncbi:MAG: hypothetical protein HOA15_02760 [Candidatus Marinimicrobia bacterium]|nr:hypothetical protein [Candidatus Neomarinimicrobiota bacterium]MBT3763178.1 hypothetical protein [Candidatus Neomarinimicrobiota bacterium]MBT4270795.1 hypothetical protein [Candidatus Neomarinimicrobiota bacterium]MBT4372101.1 hypothetical protein [Candidatus Neomarinimicrobiota bacterium]MBT4809876.1 hypothetical protein [Candidatus Neomarinimicrobiota bacterium]